MENIFIGLQSLLQALGPCFFSQFFFLACLVGCHSFNGHALYFNLSEFGIRYQLAIHKKRRPYPGTDGKHNYESVHMLPGTEVHFSKPGGVRIVDNRNRVTGYLGKQLLCIDIHPRRVNAFGRDHIPVTDRCGKGTAYRTAPVEVFFYDLVHLRQYLGRGGILQRRSTVMVR